MALLKASVLVIDDDPDVLTALLLFLKGEVTNVYTEKNPQNINSLLVSKAIDLVLLDMNFSASVNTGNEGLYWLKRIKALKPDAPVVMITAYGDIDLAVRSLKEGATDFIVKPWHNDKLIEVITYSLKKPFENHIISNRDPENEIIGNSQPMLDIFSVIGKIAPTDANVLILGENGTGKELIAKAIHQRSLRAEKPFVSVDLGALSESLFESELFGHKKGAFTDAKEERVGRFVAAEGGTLFLDEIGNISLAQQGKLLTAIQNRQVIPLGSNLPVDVNLRLICATNLSLTELSNEQRFRKDLIYRINTIDIVIPPLRNRKIDIPLLANHFLKKYGEKYFKPGMSLSGAAIEKLKNYRFPGNVRELQYMMERAVIMSDNSELKSSDLIFSPLEYSPADRDNETETRLSDIEKKTILKVIDKNNGNITKAARELGITRTALYRRLSRYEQ
ncbi:MAG TPA: sigma-54 dependent transcriptional regulator [Lentimicrobium sp.]|nr:sigma-54 dependent transcriptional regulator [Lentimicrobium sp.]